MFWIFFLSFSFSIWLLAYDIFSILRGSSLVKEFSNFIKTQLHLKAEKAKVEKATASANRERLKSMEKEKTPSEQVVKPKPTSNQQQNRPVPVVEQHQPPATTTKVNIVKPVARKSAKGPPVLTIDLGDIGGVKRMAHKQGREVKGERKGIYL